MYTLVVDINIYYLHILAICNIYYIYTLVMYKSKYHRTIFEKGEWIMPLNYSNNKHNYFTIVPLFL